MKNAKAVKPVLIIAGLIGTGIGGAILLAPIAFNAANGVDLERQAGVLSETRAAGGLLLALGVLILAGAFIAELRFTATLVATIAYLSYGLSRVLSMVGDGIPPTGLVQAAAVELATGLACLVVLVRYRDRAGMGAGMGAGATRDPLPAGARAGDVGPVGAGRL